MIPLEERVRKPREGVHYAEITQTPLLRYYFENIQTISLAPIPRKNQLMRRGGS
jgi:hypothetical protein